LKLNLPKEVLEELKSQGLPTPAGSVPAPATKPAPKKG